MVAGTVTAVVAANKKTSLVTVSTADGVKKAACPANVSALLKEGDCICVVTHCVEQDLKNGAVADAQVPHATYFQDKQLHISPLYASAPGRVEWLNSSAAPPQDPFSLSMVGKVLKTLAVDESDHSVTFSGSKAVVQDKPVICKVKGTIKI